VYCCAIVASTQDLAFVYAIAWTALNLLVNPYMAMFNLYTLGWGFSWLRFFSPFNYAWQVRCTCAGSCWGTEMEPARRWQQRMAGAEQPLRLAKAYGFGRYLKNAEVVVAGH
jgi:hypothetical protein